MKRVDASLWGQGVLSMDLVAASQYTRGHTWTGGGTADALQGRQLTLSTLKARLESGLHITSDKPVAFSGSLNIS